MTRALPALAALLLSLSLLSAQEAVRVYPAPPGEILSPRYAVTVAGQVAPAYIAQVSSLDPVARRTSNSPTPTTDTAFTSFDMRGPAEVIVTCPDMAAIQSAVILPSARGIQPVVSGNKVTFTVSQPGALVLEINGNWKNSLQLFANPWDADAPDPKDPNVIYYGPGLHEVRSVEVTSGKTVYVAGGAVVYGVSAEGDPDAKKPIFFLKGDHITLRGRGIIDGSRCAFHTRNMIVASGNDILLEGVVLRDSSTWNVPLQGCDRLRIENFKIFGWRGNSDGLDINNCRTVDVSGCFLRTWDDLVVVKASARDRGESADITVHNCVLWNEIAHALSLGAEMSMDVENVHFTDCDVVRDKGREWTLRIYQCDAGHIRNITFDNIRIEEGQRLFSAWIGKAVWSHDAERGHIDNVVFRDITANASRTLAELKGFDADHAVHGVLFDRVTVNGRPLKDGDVARNEFVSDVSVTP